MIRYNSTRSDDTVDLGTALSSGLAPDGGLYVPTEVPYLGTAHFDGAEDIAAVAGRLLEPYFRDSSLQAELADVCAETFSFPLPLRVLNEAHGHRLCVLELFHGPTAAFKDVGARFLASCLSRLQQSGSGDTRPVLILVATSGDTGGAVAAAFHGRKGFEVGVLFPSGRVSVRQQHQLTCWGGNVSAFCVQGSFDDCQRMVKQAFVDPDLAKEFRFSSANSINIGRLLPQSAYYAYASLQHWRATGRTLSFVVPTGNLGNGLACVLARAAGLPIGDIVLATNANKTIPDYLASGHYRGRDSIATLASAMDVGDPSNMERLRRLFGEAERLRGSISAYSVDDDTIRERIRQDYRDLGVAWCPHTATAMHVYRALPAEAREQADWAIVATAHPAKFESVVEPLIGVELEVPVALQELLQRPAKCAEIEPTLEALAKGLRER